MLTPFLRVVLSSAHGRQQIRLESGFPPPPFYGAWWLKPWMFSLRVPRSWFSTVSFRCEDVTS